MNDEMYLFLGKFYSWLFVASIVVVVLSSIGILIAKRLTITRAYDLKIGRLEQLCDVKDRNNKRLSDRRDHYKAMYDALQIKHEKSIRDHNDT